MGNMFAGYLCDDIQFGLPDCNELLCRGNHVLTWKCLARQHPDALISRFFQIHYYMTSNGTTLPNFGDMLLVFRLINQCLTMSYFRFMDQ